jgi:hypothetical protein
LAPFERGGERPRSARLRRGEERRKAEKEATPRRAAFSFLKSRSVLYLFPSLDQAAARSGALGERMATEVNNTL